METKKLENEIKKVIANSGATYDDAIFYLGEVESELKSKATEHLEKLPATKFLDVDPTLADLIATDWNLEDFPQVTTNNKEQAQVKRIDELIDKQLSYFSDRVPADLEMTQTLVQLLLARMLAKF